MIDEAKKFLQAKFGLWFTKDGREIPDPTPLEIPAGFKRPETLQEQIRRLIRTDISAEAVSRGEESFEEANDFDMDDDDAELHETHHELTEEVIDAEREVRKERAASAAKPHGRRAVRGEEAEGGEDDDEAPAARSAARAGVQRESGKVKPRSPQRRSTGRREDAESEDDDLSD